MDISCNIIKDLLPLYAEDMVSNDSRRMVDDHLCGCDACTKQLARMLKPEQVPAEIESHGLDALRQSIEKRRWLLALLTFFLTAATVVGIFVYFTRPIYLTAEEAGIQIIEEDDKLIFKFGEKVDCYTVEAETFEGEENWTVTVTAYRRIWNVHYGNMLNALVNVVGEDYPFSVGHDVQRINYSNAPAGEEDTLIWGEPLCVQSISLPRLVLGYYILIAFGLGAVLLVLAWLIRKHKGCVAFLCLSALFISFGISGLIITGGDWRVYAVMEMPTYLLLTSVMTFLIWGASICCGLLYKIKNRRTI